MKLRIFSPRLFLRTVKALESIATSLTDLRNATYQIHKIQGRVDIVSDDTDDDDTVSYTSERDVWEYQQRIKERARSGFPLDGDDLPPSH